MIDLLFIQTITCFWFFTKLNFDKKVKPDNFVLAQNIYGLKATICREIMLF